MGDKKDEQQVNKESWDESQDKDTANSDVIPMTTTELDDYHNKTTLPMPDYKKSTSDPTKTTTTDQNQVKSTDTNQNKQTNVYSAVELKRYRQKCMDDDDTATAEPRPWWAINKELISLKIILFCWYAAGACLLPYMTLHMKQLGLTMVEMTAIYAILPIIQLLGTPLAGFIADKTGNYKSVLLFTLTTCIVTTFLLQFFVPARKKLNPMTTNTAEYEAEPDPLYMVTFWLYLIIRVFHQVAVGLTYVLLDTTTLVLAHQNNSNYGRQRFWAILATGIFSPICGLVIDRISSKNIDLITSSVIYNYDPAFYFFNVLTAITLFKSSLLDIEISALPRNVWKDVKELLKSGNVWIFLFAVFIMGSCWGFLESFLFIHLEKIGAPTFLLGLTVTVGALVGLPFLFESDWFVKKVGATELLILALVVYTVRLVGYSLLDNPWWCIPYELMEAFTLHLMWVSTVGLAFKISPPGMLATLQAIVGGLNFGVGRGFGSLVGGSIIVVYDIRTAFRVLASLALGTAILWAILHKFFLKPLDELDKKTPQMLQPRTSQRSSKRSSKRSGAAAS